VEELGATTSDVMIERGVETNRESTETEVVMSTTSSSNSSSETIVVDVNVEELEGSGGEEAGGVVRDGKGVPELENGEVIANGHSSSADSAVSSGDENCNREKNKSSSASSSPAVVPPAGSESAVNGVIGGSKKSSEEILLHDQDSKNGNEKST
jgi:hypothetical protein